MGENVFGRALKRRRLEMGKTQAEFAEILGISPRSLQEYEYGNQTPNEVKAEEMLGAAGYNDTEGLLAEISHRNQTEAHVPVYHVKVLTERANGGFDLRLEELPRAEFSVEPNSFEAIYHESPEHFYTVTMIGDSLAPSVMPGEVLMMQRCEGLPIVQGGIYLMTGRFGIRINRLKFMQDQILITCDNPAYENSAYTYEDFDSIFTLHLIARSVRKML